MEPRAKWESIKGPARDADMKSDAQPSVADEMGRTGAMLIRAQETVDTLLNAVSPRPMVGECDKAGDEGLLDRAGTNRRRAETLCKSVDELAHLLTGRN